MCPLVHRTALATKCPDAFSRRGDTLYDSGGDMSRRHVRATSTVLVTTFSTQNCAQAGSQGTRPLPHMNLNVSERLICALWVCHGHGPCDRLKKKTVKERRQRTMEEDEPLSSSEAPRAPALDSVQGLSIPVAGPEAPFRPTSGMPAAGAAACAGPVGRLRVACIGVCAVSARAG